MYTLTHDERYFSNPEFFIPERWIESERGQETCTKAAWIPFSYGPRTCLGKPYVPIIDKSEASLALMELRMMISMFVWYFDVEFIEEGQSEPFYEDAFVAMRGPLQLRVSPAHRK
jgi:cytochrome P450